MAGVVEQASDGHPVRRHRHIFGFHRVKRVLQDKPISTVGKPRQLAWGQVLRQSWAAGWLG